MKKEFSIEQSRCIKCKKCIEVCPIGLLDWSTEKQEIFYLKKAEEFCHQCGHCVAICKNKAVIFTEINNDEPEKASSYWNSCGDIVEKLIKNRRSIRNYKDVKVNKREIEKLIAITAYAPSASNAHLTEWRVYSDDGKIKEISKLTVEWMKNKINDKHNSLSGRYIQVFNKFIADWENGNDIILRNAPHFILVHGPNTGTMRRIDGIITLDYFEFIAVSSGFGTCWAGLFYYAIEDLYQPLLNYLSLPDNHICYGAMMFGYPQYKYTFIPRRKSAPIVYQ